MWDKINKYLPAIQNRPKIAWNLELLSVLMFFAGMCYHDTSSSIFNKIFIIIVAIVYLGYVTTVIGEDYIRCEEKDKTIDMYKEWTGTQTELIDLAKAFMINWDTIPPEEINKLQVGLRVLAEKYEHKNNSNI